MTSGNYVLKLNKSVDGLFFKRHLRLIPKYLNLKYPYSFSFTCLTFLNFFEMTGNKLYFI